jgi:hypothetical protein
MANKTKRSFNWRGLVSVTTGLSFLAMSISGIVLFVTPFGRVAHWTGWRMLALTKEQWAAQHIWFSLVFMVTAAFHIYLNWRLLLNYFKDKARTAFALRWEWILSLIICGIVAVGTFASITPFDSLLAWNESIKHSWEVAGQQAPIPHAELMTLAEIADKVGSVEAGTMIRNLRSRGIQVESAEVIFGKLAQANNLTPYQLYAIALGRSGPGRDSQKTGRGYGLGQLTLRQYCNKTGLEINTATEKLQNKDIQAKPDMLLRDIAHSAGVHASDIRDILEQ